MTPSLFREALGLGHQVPTHAGTLPHGIGCERQHLQSVFSQPIRQCAGQLIAFHQSHQRRHVHQRNFRIKRADACAAEVALEEVQHRGALGVFARADNDGGQFDVGPAAAHQLKPRISPVNKSATTRTSQHGRLGGKQRRSHSWPIYHSSPLLV